MVEFKSTTELFDSGKFRKFKDKMKLIGETGYFLFSLLEFIDAVFEASIIGAISLSLCYQLFNHVNK